MGREESHDDSGVVAGHGVPDRDAGVGRVAVFPVARRDEGAVGPDVGRMGSRDGELRPHRGRLHLGLDRNRSIATVRRVDRPAPGPAAHPCVTLKNKGSRPAPGAQTRVDLRDIRPADLADPARAAELHRQAVARGLVPAGEHGLHRFRAAIEHARAVGREPARLLAWIVLKGGWCVLTHRDEDAARRRLAPPRPAPRPVAPPPALASPYRQESAARQPTALADLLSRFALKTSPIP